MSAPSPEHLALVRQWVALAEEDLTNAAHTLTLEENCPLTTVCFHAQQAVEKYLKAYLLYCTIPFPRIHDISELYILLPADLQLPISAEEQQRLSDYAVTNRYPGQWEPLERDDAEEALKVAKRVQSALRPKLPLET